MAALLNMVLQHNPIDNILKHPSLEQRKEELRARISELPFHDIDPGVFDCELLKQGIVPRPDQENLEKKVRRGKGNISEGTYAGTQAAITHTYKRIERRQVQTPDFESYFDVLQIEPTIPRFIDLEFKRQIYQYSSFPYTSKGGPAYPPHLECIPPQDRVSQLRIFNALGFAETGIMLQQVIPDSIVHRAEDLGFNALDALVAGQPQAGPTIADCERYNRFHRKTGTDIERGNNIGLLPDWYSDRRFAEQSFTGTNPTTIEKVPLHLLEEFIQTAKRTGYDYWAKALAEVPPSSLYVQDFRYLRKAVGVDPEATLHHKEPVSDDNWACASVTLFQLHPNGKLHPVAIVCDYKMSMAHSVTIFNRRHRPSDPSTFEKEDWPWRYAKTCAQVSDWIRHEVGVHLTRAHFVEESIIVATHRTIPMEHIVYRILQPHWYKTLSLNAAARETLVPQVIKDLVGLDLDQCYGYMAYEFENFDFVDNYVPNDLARRGFPNTKQGLADGRYKNYAYGKNILSMWHVIRKYVRSMLLTYYDDRDEAKADEQVMTDMHVQNWCMEAQINGRIKNFPSVKTLDQLCDALTMSIHIAAPFHTTVNYLQNFYQAFVPAKPPMLCQDLPRTLDELLAYTEADFTKALPIGRQREWLLAAQVPWLLSFKVASDRSLIAFAQSQWRTHVAWDAEARKVRAASEAFYNDLQGLEVEFLVTSMTMDRGSVPYMVMDPSNTAVSILI